MKHSDAWWRTFNTKPMADRQIDQLIGLAQGIVADGIVNQAEAEMLQNWLRANQWTENPYVSRLLDRVERVLEDGVLDEDEGRELHDALMSWTGGGGADGEESPQHRFRSTQTRELCSLRRTPLCLLVPAYLEREK